MHYFLERGPGISQHCSCGSVSVSIREERCRRSDANMWTPICGFREPRYSLLACRRDPDVSGHVLTSLSNACISSWSMVNVMVHEDGVSIETASRSPATGIPRIATCSRKLRKARGGTEKRQTRELLHVMLPAEVQRHSPLLMSQLEDKSIPSVRLEISRGLCSQGHD